MKVSVTVDVGGSTYGNRQQATVELWSSEAENILDGLAKLKASLDEVIRARLPEAVVVPWMPVVVNPTWPAVPTEGTGGAIPAGGTVIISNGPQE